MQGRTFELLLSDGKTVTHDGHDGIDAARRYVAAHPEATVIAWREVRHGVSVGLLKIID